MEQPTSDFGVDYSREVEFKFLRDDLVDSTLVPEVGDIILYDKLSQSPKEYKLNGEEVVIMSQNEVLSILYEDN